MIELPQVNLVKEISAAIRRHGITRKELFARAKVDQTNLEKWRKGVTPSTQIMVKMVKAINSLEAGAKSPAKL